MRRLLPLLLLAGTSCSGTDIVEPGADGVMPLAVGASWTYSVADSGKYRDPQWDSTRVASITRDTIGGGRHWYYADAPDLIGTSAFNWFTNDGGTLYQGIPPFTIGWLAFQDPPKIGQVSYGPSGAILPTSGDTIVTVPAGTFHCFRYDWVSQSTGGSFTTLRWVFVAPGVGVVKEVRPTTTESGVVVAWRIRVLLSRSQ